MNLKLKLRYSVILMYIICLPIFSQTSLKGSIYRSFDFRIVEINFYDDTLCKCTQSFYFSMPHEPMCKVDTFVYHVEKNRLFLDASCVLDNTKSQNKLCADYLMYGFFFSRFIMRDGNPLLQYPISPLTVQKGTIQATKAKWIEWARCTEGIFQYNDILSMTGGITLYRTSGAPYKYADKTDEITESICEEYGCAFPCDEELKYKMFDNYRWFSRPRIVLSSKETLDNIVGRHYIYSKDTIAFLDEMSCTYFRQDSLPINCKYRVDGAFVLVSGLNQNANSVDTLIYDHHVLYHAFVTHYSNTIVEKAVGERVFISLRQPSALERNPTARMETRAYVCDNEIVTDEQIGRTFQHVYMPINFHSKVN